VVVVVILLDKEDLLNMNLDEVLNEAVGDIWNNAHYGATSEEPRKDFVGFSTKDGYNFPYQHNAPPVYPPSEPQPPQTPDLPWPLQTVSDDIVDSFVYLVAAHNKMKTCLDQNPSLSKNQKTQLERLKIVTQKTLEHIKSIGENLLSVADLAKPLPPQSPGEQ
jgi:hypothetical protein